MEQESADMRNRNTPFFRVQQLAHRYLPSIVRNPEWSLQLAHMRVRDPELNARSEPPSDEVIDLHCVWAIEFYTPSQIAELLAGFERLGWNISDDASDFTSNPALWIQRTRQSAQGAAWMNLGIIQRPDKKAFVGRVRSATLPHGVDYGFAGMYSLTSSITCVVLGFVLDETQSRRFDKALRLKRETRIKPLRGRGYQILGPDSQKKDEISNIRSQVRELPSNWLRTYLPGLFANGILAGEYPTCELLTVRKAVPFAPRGISEDDNSQWLYILDLDTYYGVWQARWCEGLKFAWPLAKDGSNKYHAAIVAREEDFRDEELSIYGGRNRNSIVQYVDQSANKLLTRWALVVMLYGYQRYLNIIRDSLVFDSKTRSRPLQLLKDIGIHLATSIDISVMTVELRTFVGNASLFKQDIEDFYSCREGLSEDKKIWLSESLRREAAECTKWLSNIDKSVREILIQFGNALGARENIKLQGRVTLLSWAIVALTVLTLTLAVVTSIASFGAGKLALPW